MAGDGSDVIRLSWHDTNEWHPSVDNSVHESVRRNPKLKAQLGAFLLPDGVVEPPCDGACDPE